MCRIAKSVVVTPSFRRVALASLSYTAFFLALFAQFLYKGALYGNCDSLIAMALSNTYITKAAEFVGLGSAGRAMFPASNVLAYGEAAPGISAIYIFFRLLGFNDLFSSYFFISCVFSLTAVGAYVFAGLFVRSFAARLFAGYAFTCSNMMFAHIDDSAVIFYLFPLLALTFLVRFFREHDSRHLLAAAILGATQLYCSVYVFAYQSILIVFFTLVYQTAPSKRVPWPKFAKPAVLYLLVASPILIFYIASLRNSDIVSPFDPKFITLVMSWQVSDVFLALRNNILYGRFNPLTQDWNVIRHFNLIGLLVVTTGIGALALRGRHRILLGGAGLIGLLLAMGPVINLTTDPAQLLVAKKIPTPLFPLYEWIPIFRFHRIPVRAYFLVLLAISVLSSVTLQRVLSSFKGRQLEKAILVAVIAGFHFLENVPMPMQAYAQLGTRLELPREYETFLSSARADGLILDLPSRFGFVYPNWNPDEYQDLYGSPLATRLQVKQGIEIVESDNDIFLYNREALYLNWQTQHRRDIVNGVNGYFPATRLVFDRWIEDLPDERALRWLRSQGVVYLVFHRGLLLWDEHALLGGLSGSPLLRQVFSGEDIIVFEFQP